MDGVYFDVPGTRNGAFGDNGGTSMSKSKNRLKLKFAAAAISFVHCVNAAPATQIKPAASCTVNSAATLDFATGDALAANIDQTSTIRIECSGRTPYSIGLDAGAGAGATAAVRKLTGAAASVDYALYRDGARTMLWGDTVGIDAEAATCSGVAQTHTLYGRVTAQPTPVPGTYTDTITVTVTY
jgi:spore coat protein U-like protein